MISPDVIDCFRTLTVITILTQDQKAIKDCHAGRALWTRVIAHSTYTDLLHRHPSRSGGAMLRLQ